MVVSQQTLGHAFFLSLVEKVAGEDAVKVVQAILFNEKTVKDIAGDTGLKINQVRKVLYKLNKYGLVSFDKSESKFNPAYREFIWRFNPSAVIKYIEYRRDLLLENLKRQIDYYTSNQVFSCGNVNCNVYSLEQAYDEGFICPKCGAPLKPVNTREVVARIQQILQKL